MPESSGPEWLYEAGIGEARAALVADGRIVEAAIEPDNTLTVGTILAGRLVERLPGNAARVATDRGDVLLAPVPAGVTQGGRVTVAVTREAIPEPGRPKLAKAVACDAATARADVPGPDLLARIAATGLPVRRPLPHQPDALEEAGWSELLEEAATGEIPFAGGGLRMSPTPAMTLFDVDGHLAPEPLALAAAAAVAAAIRRHGIGGSIGIDFPTLAGKAPRQAVAVALDAGLGWSGSGQFERTAVNGFGFLQIVRPRPRASLPELLRADPVAAATRAALRSLERTPPGGPGRPALPTALLARLAAHPHWSAELTRRTGVVARLEP